MKSKITLLFLTLILGACSQSLPSTDTAPVPPILTPTSLPASAYEGCAYQWAYKDRPELTARFDETIKTLIPNSTSRATAYGENCIGNDGQAVRFLAMQTDFYVTATVETLDDYETFGNWIYDVMLVVDGFPPEDLAGPQPGFVEFRFEKSMTESIGFRVPIQGFFETAGEKTGEELFRLFYTSP